MFKDIKFVLYEEAKKEDTLLSCIIHVIGILWTANINKVKVK